MTREKTIEILKELWKYEKVDYTDNEVREALDIAIEALKAESCNRLKLDGMLEDAYEHGYQQAKYDYETQPCEAVSREAVMQTLYDYGCESEIQDAIEKLPPITPTRAKGKWVWDSFFEEYACSCCYSGSDTETHFCPNCGAKMEGVSE